MDNFMVEANLVLNQLTEISGELKSQEKQMYKIKQTIINIKERLNLLVRHKKGSGPRSEKGSVANDQKFHTTMSKTLQVMEDEEVMEVVQADDQNTINNTEKDDALELLKILQRDEDDDDDDEYAHYTNLNQNEDPANNLTTSDQTSWTNFMHRRGTVQEDQESDNMYSEKIIPQQQSDWQVDDTGSDLTTDTMEEESNTDHNVSSANTNEADDSNTYSESSLIETHGKDSKDESPSTVFINLNSESQGDVPSKYDRSNSLILDTNNDDDDADAPPKRKRISFERSECEDIKSFRLSVDVDLFKKLSLDTREEWIVCNTTKTKRIKISKSDSQEDAMKRFKILMLFRAMLNNVDNRLETPLGTKLQINYICQSGERKVARMSVGPQPHHYFALFEEDDVDFEISVDNTASMYRRVFVELNIHNKALKISQPQNSSQVLLGFKGTGERFHFVCPSKSKEEQQAMSWVDSGLAFKENFKQINEITFKIKYSNEIQINVTTVLGKFITFDCQPTITLGKLKKMIMDKEGMPVQGQCLIFSGKLLHDDGQTLQDYNVQHLSTIQLRWKPLDFPGQNDSLDLPHIASPSSDLDELVIVEPFVVEMRLASQFFVDEWNGPKK